MFTCSHADKYLGHFYFKLKVIPFTDQRSKELFFVPENKIGLLYFEPFQQILEKPDSEHCKRSCLWE